MTVPAPTAQPNPQPQVYAAPPQAAPSPAQPYQQPMVTPTNYGQVSPGMPTPKSRLPLILAGAGIGVLLLAAVGFLLYRTYGSGVTLSDVQAAQHTTDALSGDIEAMSGAELNITSATTASDATSQAAAANAKLADAAKQVDTLKNSKILHDASTKKAFYAFNAKWPTYYGYIKSDTADAQTLVPVILSLEDQMNQLSSNPPATTAGIAAYLASFKSDVDATSQKVAGLHMQTAENKQLVQAFQTFLQSASGDVAKAQSDLSAGRDTFTVEDDLAKVDDAQTTFDQTQQTVSDQIDNKLKQIDPSDQFTSFSEALGNLSVKTVTKS